MSLYQAYEAYERRAARGEFSVPCANLKTKSEPHGPVLAQIGDLLIQAGLKLKWHYSTDKSIAWSPMTGSKA